MYNLISTGTLCHLKIVFISCPTVNRMPVPWIWNESTQTRVFVDLSVCGYKETSFEFIS